MYEIYIYQRWAKTAILARSFSCSFQRSSFQLISFKLFPFQNGSKNGKFKNLSVSKFSVKRIFSKLIRFEILFKTENFETYPFLVIRFANLKTDF